MEQCYSGELAQRRSIDDGVIGMIQKSEDHRRITAMGT